jgi:hypothetical protein
MLRLDIDGTAVLPTSYQPIEDIENDIPPHQQFYSQLKPEPSLAHF